MITQEFISGYISAVGSFLQYTQNHKTSFAFQIKAIPSNISLLEQIALSMEIANRVYTYHGKTQNYALLVVRDRHSLLKNVIPFLENKLYGEKELRFNEWKKSIIENCSTWKFQNIKSKTMSQLWSSPLKKSA